MLARLDKHSREQYNEAINELVENGFVEEVKNDSENAFYMPHRPVFKDSSYSVRPVFDAGAKDSNGISLNSCMEVGPNLLPDLVDLFLRFRTDDIGIVSDIEKAFMQIEINPS